MSDDRDDIPRHDPADSTDPAGEGPRGDRPEDRAMDRELRELLDAQARGPLAGDLAEMERRRLFVSPEVGRRVLTAADAHLEGICRRRRFQRWAVGSAAAAAVAFAASLPLLIEQLGEPSGQRAPQAAAPPAPPHPPLDIDQSGRVDVLDAFTVARQLEAGDEEPPARWDVNGDGRVDEADVDAIAQRAVRIEGSRG